MANKVSSLLFILSREFRATMIQILNNNCPILGLVRGKKSEFFNIVSLETHFIAIKYTLQPLTIRKSDRRFSLASQSSTTMRTNLIKLYFFLFSVGILSAQSSVDYRIDWQKPLNVGVDSKDLWPHFNQADPDPMHRGLPQFCRVLASGFSANDSVGISITKSEPVPSAELEAFKGIQVPNKDEIDLRLSRGWGRQVGSSLSFCLFPFYQENGRIYRVSEFTLRKIVGSYKQASQAMRSKAQVPSPLAAGTWHKFRINESGIYKFSASFLSDEGLYESEVSINNLRLLANQHAMLPEAFSGARPSSLQEQAFKVYDLNNDGLFNNNDYLLVYLYGPHEWKYDAGNDRYNYTHNIYRDDNYCFISTDAGPSLLLNSLNSLSNPTQTVTTFDDYAVEEEDLINLVGTGRQWFGDVFEFTLSYNYNFSFANLVLNEPVELLVDVVGRVSSSGTAINTSYAASQILSNAIDPYSTFGNYPPFVERSTRRTTFNALGDNITLNLTYNNSSNPSGVAWLDRIVLNARRSLDFAQAGNSIQFRDSRSVGAGERITFQIQNAPADISVWQIQRIGAPVEMQGALTNGVFEFTADGSTLKEYVAFTGSNFPTPAFVETLEPLDLRSIEVPEMVVISHPNFRSAAEELAEYHTSSGNVASIVVDVNDIYNEFGSGGQDLTAIRDFIKDLYDRSTGNRFKYVLLFGDASYDYKDRLNGNNNFIPTWQTSYSFSLGLSSITDDFFAYMDPGEGTNFTGAFMDLGVGRIPCDNLSQAQSYVAKVRRYGEGAARFGDWRNRILLMADDPDDYIWEREYFVPRSEGLSRVVRDKSPSFNVEKIYLDAYQQETSTGSQSYPEARLDMFRKVQRGCLVTNYIGHGGEIGLASERLLQLQDVNAWTNIDALSLFVTITCEFTRFDDPKRVSAGEQLLLNPNGGAIALLSTTRVVGVQGAVDLNDAVFDTILARPNGIPQTLGEIIRAAKNDNFVRSRSTKTKFSLIGDPALRLAIPYYEVHTTELNGKPIAQAANDTIKALSKVDLKGELRDLDGTKLSNFNGVLNVSVYDKEVQRQTLANDGIGAPVNFNERSSLLYRGKVEVSNGDFNVEFRVPLGINYQFGNGKLSYYAFDSEGSSDAAGYYDTIVVGGFNENAPDDSQGPEIRLFMNDASFVRGGITGEDPFIYAELLDSSGINTVGNGVGQDLRAVLNEETDKPFILNEFYEADLNSYKSGSLRYQLFDLEPGSYQLNLRAFDIYNNPSQASTEFIVAESADLALSRVLNYPNPFTTYTEFQFEHNRANQPLEVQVQIFTVSGTLVKTINQSVNSFGNRVTGIAWDGLDDYGDKIGKGVYVYRIKVRSLSDNSSDDQYEKLVILR